FSEFFEIHIILFLDAFLNEVDLISGQFRGEANVLTVAADGKRNLVFFNNDCRSLVLSVDFYALEFGGREGTLNVPRRIIGIVNDVDVLIVELTNDGMD